MAYGTLSSLDTLAASQQSIAAFGEDNAFDAIELARQAHNEIFQEMVSGFVEISTDRQRRYGGQTDMTMDEVDEFGRGDAQKIPAGVTVGFPLRLFDVSVQWTRKYMQNAKVSELAAQFTAAETAHIKRLQREVKRAVFTSTNSTFVDRLVDSVSLAVKAFNNNDSAEIPPGPNGEAFAGSHQHYIARVGALAATDITAVIELVIEHHNTGQAMLYINRAQEAAVRGFTSNFTPYVDARIVPGSGVTVASGQLAPTNLYNRAIGIFDGAEVWVKPWIPANYMFAFVQGAPKPLVLRERTAGSSGLMIAAEDEAYPLRAKTLEAEFGVGVWTRTNGAVLYVGGTSYVIPTVT
ncbi:MAG: hypothetical protein ABIR33_09515 [Pyrinomonadaceae bacterium]